jgi:hypothetical protein
MGGLLSRLGLPPAGVEAVWSRIGCTGGRRGGAWFDPGRILAGGLPAALPLSAHAG